MQPMLGTPGPLQPLDHWLFWKCKCDATCNQCLARRVHCSLLTTGCSGSANAMQPMLGTPGPLQPLDHWLFWKCKCDATCNQCLARRVHCSLLTTGCSVTGCSGSTNAMQPMLATAGPLQPLDHWLFWKCYCDATNAWHAGSTAASRPPAVLEVLLRCHQCLARRRGRYEQKCMECRGDEARI